jgi:hypothetical protein
VPEPDDRHSVGEGTLVGVDDDLAARLAHGAALDGGVGGESYRRRAVDQTATGEHPAVVAGGDELKGAVVEEGLEPEVGVPWVDLDAHVGTWLRSGGAHQ